MSFYTTEKLQKYHKIYQEIYDNPYVHQREICVNTGITKSTVSRYLQRMYDLSIILGPSIFVKPAQNYREYAHFLHFDNSRSAYERFKGFSSMRKRSLNCGSWDLLLICEKLINFSILKGFKQCIHRGVKGVTYLSKVTSLNWNHCMRKMQDAVSQPKEKSILYEEVPFLPWNEKEWMLYRKFSPNVRAKCLSLLRECKIRFEYYRKWVSLLPEFTYIQPAFYPVGIDNYLVSDFLFETSYQKQLAHILGMLPSTSLFFSVSEHLFARLYVLTRKEKDDLFSVIFQLGEEGFFKNFFYASTILSDFGGLNE